jgi:hypothetical protein
MSSNNLLRKRKDNDPISKKLKRQIGAYFDTTVNLLSSSSAK